MVFEKILVALTLITGIFWLINKFFKTIKNNNIKETIDYISSFFVIFLIVLIFRTFFVEPYRIPSGSMRPTLVEGDFILVNKYKYGLRLPINHKKILSISQIKRGDVIIFWQESSKKVLIKRVIGLPGDHVVYKNQNLYINNDLIDTKDYGVVADVVEPNILTHQKQETLNTNTNINIKHEIYVNPNYTRSYPFDDIVVGKDSYFVMGDNRDYSADSRFSGLVAEKDVLGKAFFVWFSFDWKNKAFRFERIFKKIK
jgi:signal peptidase I